MQLLGIMLQRAAPQHEAGKGRYFFWPSVPRNIAAVVIAA
jgi:hypothetical protein